MSDANYIDNGTFRMDFFNQVDHFRLRTLPVLGTIPAIFGQTMATWVLCELGNKQFLPATMVGLGRALRNKLLQRLKVCIYVPIYLFVCIYTCL